MKKHVSVLALSLALATTFYACKKENSQTVQPQSKSATTQTTSGTKALAKVSSSTSLTVDSRGFLSFKDENEMEDLIKNLTEGTHGEAKAFFESKGFAPKALSMFGESFNDEMVTAEQAPYYLMSAVATVQLDEVVMKLTDDENAVLTLTGDNINNDTYEALANGEFNSSVMNRFVAGMDAEEEPYREGFVAYNKANPSGHDGATTTTTPIPVSGRRRFWGRSRDCKDRLENGIECHDSYYIFWIRVWRGPSDYYTTP